MPNAVRIVIAEESALYRRGLRDVLMSDGFDVVAETGVLDEASELAEEHQPEIVLLGLGAPTASAVAAIRGVVDRSSQTHVVALIPSTDRGAVIRALRAGAAGCLTMDESPAGLTRALRGLMRGEAPLSRVAASFLVEQVQREERRRELAALVPDRDHLTPRQLEILDMLARGATTAGIARELYLSIETVRWHVKSILRKLQVSSRAEAIACLEELRAG